jgi:zinc protease
MTIRSKGTRFMKFLRLAGLWSLLLAAPALAQTDLSSARLTTLDNGLKLLLVPDSTASSLDVASWFEVGSADEGAGLTGITLMLERIMLRGPGPGGPTERLRMIQAEGGSAGAFTTQDVTCFYETLPPSALDLALSIEAQRIKSLGVTTADLDLERNAMRSERRQESTHAGRGLLRLYAALYPASGYRRSVAGDEGDRARITARDAETWFRNRFAPNQALVTVVGAFDADEALRAAKLHLGAIPKRSSPAVTKVSPTSTAPRKRVSERTDLELPLVFVGWRAPGQSGADAVALDLLGRVLSSGPSARLARPLGSAGETNVVIAQGAYDGRADAGVFYAFAATTPDADSARVEKDLIWTVEHLADEPVSADELDRARRQAEIGILLAWQTAHGRSQSLGLAQLVEGDYQKAWQRIETMRALTPQDLQKAAARVLKPDTRCVAWMTPARKPVPPTAGGGKP